jgi:site-specific DNA-methyltransferase (adenine-specific)
VYADPEERYRIIIEECLYFSDINPLNIFIAKLLLDPKDQYQLNYNEGDTLKLDITEKWGIDKFSAVIGNPPYNKEFNKNGAGASPIYHTFTEKMIGITTILLFVTPSRWFVGGKGLDKFRDMMLNRTDIKLIRHFENPFKNVDIKGGISYFLIHNGYDGMCDFNGNKIKLDNYDILVTRPEFLSVIDNI